MKHALVIRHNHHEDLAGFEPPILAAGYAIERLDVTDPGFADRDLMAPDLLVLMGGLMGAYERDLFPWIEGELTRLAERIAADRPTLGVCLGSQMIAGALGGRNYAGSSKEVGYAPVDVLAAGEDSPLRHVAGVPMLHWHGDTFDLPDGVEHLASTALYPNQAFRRGANLLALQFHPEMGEDPKVELWIEHGTAMIAAAGTDAETIRADQERHGPKAVVAGQAMLAEWLAGLS